MSTRRNLIMRIFILPLWIFFIDIVTYPAVMKKIICYFNDEILEFQVFDKPLRNSRQSKMRAEDISCNSSCGIAISIMIDGCDNSFLKVAAIPD